MTKVRKTSRISRKLRKTFETRRFHNLYHLETLERGKFEKHRESVEEQRKLLKLEDFTSFKIYLVGFK